MKYENVGALINAHIQDIVDTVDGDDQCVYAAISTLLTVMYAARNNDEEKVIEDVEAMARNVKFGIDSGKFKAFRCVTIN